MNAVERFLARKGWQRVEGKMGEKARRWIPLFGTAVLVTVVGLRLFGQEDLARTVETLGSATGVTTQSPVGAGELAAAAAALTGIGLKVWSQIKKARGQA